MMENQQMDKWLGYEGLLSLDQEDHLDFGSFPLWNWQLDYPVGDDVIEATPLMQSNPWDPYLFPPCDLFQDEVCNMFDGDQSGFWDELGDESSELVKENENAAANCDREKTVGMQIKRAERSSREERAVTFEELSHYFYMPITKAAKELNIGLTLLKKKCRDLGIPRWPHRKMKSLQTLIKNVQELGREEGEIGEAQLRSAIEILEQERKMMEKEPATQLEDKTKRLRQACFKANYKKRRLMAIEGAAQATSSPGYICAKGHGYLN